MRWRCANIVLIAGRAALQVLVLDVDALIIDNIDELFENDAVFQ